MDYRRNIIVVGASYGGLTAFSKLVSYLPKSLPAPIFFVQHVSPAHMSHLADILSNRGPLRAIQPTDHSPYEEGVVYTGAPNHHLLVKNAHLRVVHGPTENRFRPSIDALFRSAAAYHTTRVVGVLLTGYQDDGVLGLEAVKRCGGTAIVQDPNEAEVGVLPRNAIQRVQVDEVLPIEGIAKKLVELSELPADPPRAVPEDIMAGAKVSEHEIQALDTMQKIADATPFTCPDCGGVLWKIKNENVYSMRCVTGHAYTLEAYMDGQGAALENALWGAIRFMEERIKLVEVLQREAHEKKWRGSAEQYAKTTAELKQHASVLRNFVMSGSLNSKGVPMN